MISLREKVWSHTALDEKLRSRESPWLRVSDIRVSIQETQWLQIARPTQQSADKGFR